MTHAAGAAALLARQTTDTSTSRDQNALLALRPDRFDSRPDQALERQALHLYRDIYGTSDSA